MATPPIIPIVEPKATQGVTIIGEDGQTLLIADATVTETHQRNAKITQYPRENDSPASNHIQPEQPDVTIDFIVSKTSLRVRGGINRDSEAFELLESLQVNSRLVTLVTSLKVYESMGLASLRAPRSSANGQKLLAQTKWQRLETVTTQTTQIPADLIAPAARASAKDEDDTADQVQGGGDVQTQKKTLLKSLANAGANAID